MPSAFGHTWLKWPNDVLLGSTAEDAAKVGGILIESVMDEGGLQSAILGIGVNVNQLAGDLPEVPAAAPPPGSLRLFAGAPLRRDDLLVALCTELSTLLSPAVAATTIYTAWRELLATLGRAVTVTLHGGGAAPMIGRAVDVTPAGEIIVEDDSGTRHTFAAGDVSLRNPDA
jgi:BirA family biotin operon repressor/biotin-[acetyl-CoA-carboxylase] ligase